ncbi:hypothetical protein [Pragia fontium]|uniref:Uncharacterized protein n=2 Tax=Pragia fontium TaxID=82985 RepID=A0AAJ4WAZ5_9GAMM|nr:hypothetical protein [Pragia fontium]GKX62443.1 hypothetical protein SOASR032_10120 [Pragia fontium]SFC90748.1 hypothetical protein SAMN02745723_105180 [Pragia fontium DSM 5563 = ATCC 49100]SUB83058.1 Uncharacterised protein [Pragia fontium]VEJ55955.1 Uncharacterised protein [Pragia fontium]
MNSEITKRWVDAAIALKADSTAKTLCPVCQQGFLKVQDVKNKANPLEFERHLTCDTCGAYSSLRMSLTAK